MEKDEVQHGLRVRARRRVSIKNDAGGRDSKEGREVRG
jgi:hypothetical protein